MKNTETEYKWNADSPRAFARMRRLIGTLARVEKTENLHLHDYYLDDENRALRAQKIALRLRQTGTDWEATLKTRTEVKNGKARRREYTLPLPEARNFSRALTLLENKKTWQKANLKNLRVQFEIINKREIYLLNFGGARAEMALDNCTLAVLGRKVKMKEIELELKQGSAQKLDALAEKISRTAQLPFQKNSKVFSAEQLLQLWGEK